jgi:phytol kinase
MLPNNFLALVVTLVLALSWLRINNYTARRGWISSDLSRKIIHMGTGPLFVLCWLLFHDGYWARFLAAFVPFAITLQFILVGTGMVKDESAVRSMSRSGDRREILRGPLYYGIVFVVLTLVFWKDSPTGMIALMLLCGGDGLADIVGRRFGRSRIPWNREKSWAGSLGMFAGGWLFAAGILAVFVAAGVFESSLTAYLPAITLIAAVGTLVETLPLKDLDNFTVAAAAVALGLILF